MKSFNPFYANAQEQLPFELSTAIRKTMKKDVQTKIKGLVELRQWVSSAEDCDIFKEEFVALYLNGYFFFDRSIREHLHDLFLALIQHDKSFFKGISKRLVPVVIGAIYDPISQIRLKAQMAYDSLFEGCKLETLLGSLADDIIVFGITVILKKSREALTTLKVSGYSDDDIRLSSSLLVHTTASSVLHLVEKVDIGSKLSDCRLDGLLEALIEVKNLFSSLQPFAKESYLRLLSVLMPLMSKKDTWPALVRDTVHEAASSAETSSLSCSCLQLFKEALQHHLIDYASPAFVVDFKTFIGNATRISATELVDRLGDFFAVLPADLKLVFCQSLWSTLAGNGTMFDKIVLKAWIRFLIKELQDLEAKGTVLLSAILEAIAHQNLPFSIVPISSWLDLVRASIGADQMHQLVTKYFDCLEKESKLEENILDLPFEHLTFEDKGKVLSMIQSRMSKFSLKESLCLLARLTGLEPRTEIFRCILDSLDKSLLAANMQRNLRVLSNFEFTCEERQQVTRKLSVLFSDLSPEEQQSFWLSVDPATLSIIFLNAPEQALALCAILSTISPQILQALEANGQLEVLYKALLHHAIETLDVTSCTDSDLADLLIRSSRCLDSACLLAVPRLLERQSDVPEPVKDSLRSELNARWTSTHTSEVFKTFVSNPKNVVVLEHVDVRVWCNSSDITLLLHGLPDNVLLQSRMFNLLFWEEVDDLASPTGRLLAAILIGFCSKLEEYFFDSRPESGDHLISSVRLVLSKAFRKLEGILGTDVVLALVKATQSSNSVCSSSLPFHEGMLQEALKDLVKQSAIDPVCFCLNEIHFDPTQLEDEFAKIPPELGTTYTQALYRFALARSSMVQRVLSDQISKMGSPMLWSHLKLLESTPATTMPPLRSDSLSVILQDADPVSLPYDLQDSLLTLVGNSCAAGKISPDFWKNHTDFIAYLVAGTKRTLNNSPDHVPLRTNIILLRTVLEMACADHGDIPSFTPIVAKLIFESYGSLYISLLSKRPCGIVDKIYELMGRMIRRNCHIYCINDLVELLSNVTSTHILLAVRFYFKTQIDDILNQAAGSTDEETICTMPALSFLELLRSAFPQEASDLCQYRSLVLLDMFSSLAEGSMEEYSLFRRISRFFQAHIASQFFPFVLTILNWQSGSPLDLSKIEFMTFDPDSDPSAMDIVSYTAYALSRVCKLFPSSLRSWWVASPRPIQAAFETNFSLFLSPLLIGRELARIRRHRVSGSGELELKVVQSSTTCLVTARILLEDFSVQLNLEVPPSFPLRPVSPSGGDRLGISESKWRSWLLASQTVFNSENISILDGILIWKDNVQKSIEGIEPCPICYCIVSASDRSLPSPSCRTCKNRFHASCLYKWFKTGGNATCPMCRSVF